MIAATTPAEALAVLLLAQEELDRALIENADLERPTEMLVHAQKLAREALDRHYSVSVAEINVPGCVVFA